MSDVGYVAIGYAVTALAVGRALLRYLDRTTGGAWVDRYGSDGAVLPAYEMGPRDAGALPPYIDRPEGPTEADRDDYQTVFAARAGASASQPPKLGPPSIMPRVVKYARPSCWNRWSIVPSSLCR